MDGFKDRLSQHFATPQDIITANGQAEATQVENLQAEVHALIGTIDEKLSKLQPGEQVVLPESTDGADIADQLSNVGDKLESHIHKENVKVYRNVQAAVTSELEKQTESLEGSLDERNTAIIEELTKQTEMLSAMLETINEQQKSQGEAVSGMAVRMNNMEGEVRKRIRSRALLPIQIIMFLIVAADLAVNVLNILGFLK